ncbi:alpha/beta hydrolase [Rhodobacteraceae bacterium]|nr:alpha/beta hydrolase [Paracoccaceae bacterium]
MTEPLVLLMGKFCDARLFEAQISEFSRTRMVIVAPIFYGSRISSYALDLLSQLPPKFALLGHDLGGFVAMEILRKAPERVLRFGLMSSNALSDTPQDAAARENELILIKAGRIKDVVAEEAMKSLAHRVERNFTIGTLQTMAAAFAPEHAIDQIRAFQKRPDQQGTLRKCKVPAVVICGDQDPITPVRRQDVMAAMIPYSKLHVIENTGHYPTLESPEATNAAIADWLAQPYVLRS